MTSTLLIRNFTLLPKTQSKTDPNLLVIRQMGITTSPPPPQNAIWLVSACLQFSN